MFILQAGVQYVIDVAMKHSNVVLRIQLVGPQLRSLPKLRLLLALGV